MVCAPAAVANVAIDRAMNNTGTADTTRQDDELEDMCFLGRAHGGAGFTTRMQPHHRSDAGPPARGRVPCPRRSAVSDGDELMADDVSASSRCWYLRSPVFASNTLRTPLYVTMYTSPRYTSGVHKYPPPLGTLHATWS